MHNHCLCYVSTTVITRLPCCLSLWSSHPSTTAHVLHFSPEAFEKECRCKILQVFSNINLEIIFRIDTKIIESKLPVLFNFPRYFGEDVLIPCSAISA
jgi:hypothetical protein